MADAETERTDQSLSLFLLDLLQECCAGTRTPSEIAEVLIAFSCNDTAPERVPMSDTLLDTLFLYDTGFAIVGDESTGTPRRERLGELARILIVSNIPSQWQS